MEPICASLINYKFPILHIQNLYYFRISRNIIVSRSQESQYLPKLKKYTESTFTAKNPKQLT